MVRRWASFALWGAAIVLAHAAVAAAQAALRVERNAADTQQLLAAVNEFNDVAGPGQVWVVKLTAAVYTLGGSHGVWRGWASACAW